MSERRFKRAGHSDETKALIKTKAVGRGRKGAQELRDAVNTLMLDIEKEISANEGVYPRNGGELSQNEVYRRLGLDETTIPKRHKTLRDDIKTWLGSLADKAATTRRDARRSEAKRVSDWRKLYDDLLAAFRIHELDWQQAMSEVTAKDVKLQTAVAQMTDLRHRFEALHAENQQLRAALEAATAGKVVPLRKSRSTQAQPTARLDLE